MADHANRGAAALSAGDYELAIKEFTIAMDMNPTAVDYYIKRSMAFQRSSRYPEALVDAEIAVGLAHKRAKRELIKDSQMRRVVALFHLGRYVDAKFILDVVKELDEKEKAVPTWELLLKMKLEGLPADLPADDERTNLKVRIIPNVELPKSSDGLTEQLSPVLISEAPSPPPRPIEHPLAAAKEDWYQSRENVYLSLLAKGLAPDKLDVQIHKDRLIFTYAADDNGNSEERTIQPLFAEIDPSKSTFNPRKTKIDVTLAKVIPTKWKDLRGDILAPRTNEQPPAYPTSSKNGAKNWDKVATDLTTKKTKGHKDGDDDKDGDDYDDEGGDEAGRFFKSLYKGASAEQQRAMMKSYQESGGTVLSTDWNNVGKGTVNPEPPEHMEAKNW